MKVFIAFVCLVGVAAAESCNGTDTTQCANEMCITDYVPTCENGICTCNPKPTPAGCQDLSDCNSYWSSHHCGNHQRHCINGNCECIHGNTGNHGHNG